MAKAPVKAPAEKQAPVKTTEVPKTIRQDF